MKQVLWTMFLLALTACGTQQTPAPEGMKIGKPYVIDGKTYYPEYDSTYDKIGTASWYGPGFHGKYTANGEVFNQNDLTAAHPTLPMPSLVRVTNLETGKNLIVRINDRGPFKANRIIDLSKKSAQTLGIHSLAKVRVQFLPQETEQYMAQRKGGGEVDMFALNRGVEQAKETSIAQATAPEEITTEAAPVELVSSNDVQKSSIQVADAKPVGKMPSLIREAAADDGVAQTKERVSPWKSNVKVNENETISEVEKDAVVLSESTKPAALKKDLSPSAGGTPGYFIQAGSFSAEANAMKLKSKLSNVAKVKVESVEAAGKSWWRVRVGPFSDKALADEKLAQVRDSGVPDARIVQQ